MRLLDNMFRLNSTRNEGEDTVFSVTTILQCPVYKAHFPNHPITPGVCLTQLAEELLSQHLGEPLKLTTIKNIKYLAVLTPAEDRHVEYAIRYNPENRTAQIVIRDSESTYAKMTLRY